MEKQTHSSLSKPLRCIVKLGGAAITCKNELEKINEENLKEVSMHLREAMMSAEVVGMDWSRRPRESDISINVDEITDRSLKDSSNFIVVHGAGSFGHFQASKAGVHKGGLDHSLVKAGFVATRISVTTLKVASADITTIATAIDSGFIPVLHGDAVLDHSQGCTILSGAVIIRHIADSLRPEYVVFLVSLFY